MEQLTDEVSRLRSEAAGIKNTHEIDPLSEVTRILGKRKSRPFSHAKKADSGAGTEKQLAGPLRS